MDGHRYTALFEAPGGEPLLDAYMDSRGIWTIGIGHTGPEVKQGLHWTREQCLHTYDNDYAIGTASAPSVIGVSCWPTLSIPRQAVLADMVFNIGKHGLENFHNMLDAIRASKWQAAHDELLDSEYAGQVHGRATKNAQALLTGEWP